MSVPFRQYLFFGGNIVMGKAHRGHLFSGIKTEINLINNLHIAYRIFAIEVILCIMLHED